MADALSTVRDEFAMNESVGAPCTDSTLISLTGGGTFVWTDVFVVVAVILEYALGLAVPVSCGVEVRADVVAMLANTAIGTVSGNSFGVSAAVNASRSGVTASAFDLVPEQSSAGESPCFAWERRISFPNTAWLCVALQAWMPSFHV